MSKIIGMNGMPPVAGLEFNILDQPAIACARCGLKLFEIVNVLKKVNKVYIGTPHDQIVPIQLFRCVSCGELCTEGLTDDATHGESSTLLKILS